MDFTILGISILAGVSVVFIMLGIRGLRKSADIEDRIRMIGTSSGPSNLRELEMEAPFTERVLKPTLRNTLHTAGRMAPKSNAERTRRRIIIAGTPYNMTLLDFMGLRLVAAIALGIVGAMIATMREMAFPLPVSIGVVAGVLGLYVPNYWLNRRIKTRQTGITRALPDALDMLTIAVDAGLGFDQALLKVAEKWDNELTRELGRVITEMRLGVRRTDALRNLVYRTDVTDLGSFVAVLIQADQLGVSIASILHAQSEQLRMRRRQRAEEEAGKAPLKMLIPLVIFIFPSLFVVILGPAVPRFMRAFNGM